MESEGLSGHYLFNPNNSPYIGNRCTLRRGLIEQSIACSECVPRKPVKFTFPHNADRASCSFQTWFTHATSRPTSYAAKPVALDAAIMHVFEHGRRCVLCMDAVVNLVCLNMDGS